MYRMVRRLLRSVVFGAYNLVLNTLHILEEESIVAWGVYSGYSRGGLTSLRLALCADDMPIELLRVGRLKTNELMKRSGSERIQISLVTETEIVRKNQPLFWLIGRR